MERYEYAQKASNELKLHLGRQRAKSIGMGMKRGGGIIMGEKGRCTCTVVLEMKKWI